uniref:F-box domain-containing protein n=1 Tax=Onchocerca volvulus TaxID=6282 RepID=A0A8R1XZS6_ONCVO
MDAITESPERYWPVSSKYDTIDRKYKFFKAPHASRMQTYYPLIQLGRTSYSSSRRSAIAQKAQIPVGNEMDVDEFAVDSDVTKNTFTTINDLSNDILLTVFDYCHPIDLIHCFSLVSRRWNYLTNHSALFTEVRVLVNELSLKYGSVKRFFQRTSQYLRKLCIDCSVPLPSAEVNALFDICFPHVIHLDIGSFKEMNIIFLKKLSNCFPNVETLHMDGVMRCSISDQNGKEWNEMLEMLFDDENIFPKMQNFFMGSVEQYCSKTNARLSTCKRPLNLLYIHQGATRVNFSEIKISPWKTTLTELYLGYSIENEDFRYIAELRNLKVFSLAICLYTLDEDIAPLKNLYNLEELRMHYGGQDCDLSTEGMIDLFTLPVKEPEKSFPYKLKHLEIADFHVCRTDLLKAIDQKHINIFLETEYIIRKLNISHYSCPELRTLGLSFNEYMGDDAMPFIISNFKRLVFLDLSNLGDSYKDEVWNNLNSDDLPDLHLLKLHGNEVIVYQEMGRVNIENLQCLNLKRPKLLISTKWNYFINWTKTENGCIFHDTFDGDIRAVENDLRQIDGFRDFTITSPLF